jgi:hypothetical protein
LSFVRNGGATGCEVLRHMRHAVGSSSFFATGRGGHLNLRELWRTGESRHQVLPVMREGHPIQRAGGHSGHDAHCGDVYTSGRRSVGSASVGGSTSKAYRSSAPAKNGAGCETRTICHGGSATIKREQSAPRHHYNERGGTRLSGGRTDVSVCVAEARRPESASRRNAGSGAAGNISAGGDQYRASQFRTRGAGNSRDTAASGRIVSRNNAGREYCVGGRCSDGSSQSSQTNTI